MSRRSQPFPFILLISLVPALAWAQEAPDASPPPEVVGEESTQPTDSAQGAEPHHLSESAGEGSEALVPEIEVAEAASADPSPGQPDSADATEASASGGQGQGGPAFYVRSVGTYQLRANLMSDIPLNPLPREPDTDELGQNFWGEQWFRLRMEAGLDSRVKVIGEIDVFDGVVFGDFTQGVDAAVRAREDATAFPGVDPRALYVEYLSPIGLFRGGLMTSHWGLGILANDGAHEPPFGDYRYGNVVTRAAFATRPLGPESPFTVALAGDLVFDDMAADIRDNEAAVQGILAAYYKDPENENRTVGLYGVLRRQRNEMEGEHRTFDDELDVSVADIYASWDMADPMGGRLFGAVEAAYIRGTTTTTRTTVRDEHNVRQLMAVGQLGRKGDFTDVVFELGYASGDSNTEDSRQGRAIIHPDHRVGMLLFPEVLAWQTARAATLAQSDVLLGRPSPGSDRIPTNGGVAGAVYLFPHTTLRLASFLEARFGAVWARATSAVVDPYVQRSRSRSVNYRGGDPKSRDLGLELDASIRCRGEISRGVELNGGLEGAVLFPGHAFDDADAGRLPTLGLIRARVGLSF